ncbi:MULTISPECIES: hypothetical protein [Arthrobacter]|uniref:Uncharacterized protein n=1 Tax=Arthrobacter caoxuetaonis TaxID=2886935 RepID=A0A9X1MGJ7_9MICC|nr:MULTISPECIES: hypothetical protein [Arthrobacter]MCC3281889.1 hypothetical protein [Arthrobacter caoxuetaonis]MCC3283072.1 hypothetical protein [Arthrobacter caoxuetaonis]MCC3298189.1 hypothetical protein [Arthrobacter caoxuetaonis]MCC9194668.1 hypothetical protein [Arthrobacter sp. zg-Y916]USQ57192.1 hypothetical protein NF551_15930 [Arthrobacter caoxuetaonis]
MDEPWERCLPGQGEEIRRGALKLDGLAEELRDIQRSLVSVDENAWRSPAGRQFEQCVQQGARTLASCLESLALSVQARREVAAAAEEEAWAWN